MQKGKYSPEMMPVLYVLLQFYKCMYDEFTYTDTTIYMLYHIWYMLW